MRILGVVLAGGASSRFGSDKALAELDGKPLIDHAIEAIASLVERVAISGRSHGGHIGLADRPSPGLGPLGGLNAALARAEADGFEGVLSVPCDVPHYPAGLLARLVSNGGPAILDTLPVCGYWPASLAPRLDALLAEGGSRSMRRWASVAEAAIVATGGPLPNVNAPDDLAGLERR